MATVKPSSSILVPAPNRDLAWTNPLIRPLLVLSIFSFVPALMLFDLLLWQYQNFYFVSLGIPRIKRSDYVVIDRHKLSQLNLIQKISCLYCGYANGIASLAKAVAAQTELYSCAIKHSRQPIDQAQAGYYDYEDFK